jgi:hypothetical protein
VQKNLKAIGAQIRDSAFGKIDILKRAAAQAHAVDLFGGS